MSKGTQIRMSTEQRVDAFVVDEGFTVTRQWQDVSAAVAKKLVSSSEGDRPLFETREAPASDNGAEAASEAGES